MKKVSKKVLLALLAVAVLFAGGNILRLENAEANPTRVTYRVAFAPTSVRLGTATRPDNFTTTELRQAASASHRRTTAAPVEHNGWTWVRGRLTAHTNDTNFRGTTGANGVNYNGRDIWISTSQLTDGNTSAGVCSVSAGDTALRHAPSNGPSGSVARIPSGAIFRLAGDAPVTNGGFRWRLGTLVGNNTNTRSTLDGSVWNQRTVWIAHTQLTATGGTPVSSCN